MTTGAFTNDPKKYPSPPLPALLSPVSIVACGEEFVEDDDRAGASCQSLCRWIPSDKRHKSMSPSSSQSAYTDWMDVSRPLYTMSCRQTKSRVAISHYSVSNMSREFGYVR